MANLKDVLGKIGIPSDGTFIVPPTVTEIENCAFKDCKNLLAIQIPDSVTTIGWHVFEGCCNLKEITIPAKVDTIANEAFSGWFPERINVDPENKYFYTQNGCLISNCSNYSTPWGEKEESMYKHLLRGCKGISTIPEGVTDIDIQSLSGLDFKTISIPDSVVRIHMHAFEDCKSLEHLTLPESVDYIDSFAFVGCTSLERINIPTKIKELDQGLFSGCISLSEIHIPDNVRVNDNTFKGCKNLRKIHIPNFREPITVHQNDIARIFRDCNLDEITISPSNKDYKMAGDCVLDKTGKKLILGCNKSIIPETVEEIGNWAFNGCTGLTKITIPNNVKSIGVEAFHGCTSLESVKLPSGLIEIGLEAFSDCSSLEKINLPDSLEKIGKEAFGSCYKLDNISVTELFDKDNISFKSDSFRGAPAAKGLGLWNGQDYKAIFDKWFKKIKENAGK